MKRLMHLAIGFVVLAYGLLVILALNADKMIFLPHPSGYSDAQLTRAPRSADSHSDGAPRSADSQREAANVGNSPASTTILPVRLHSGSENISAVYLPNPNANYTLLYSHGNAEDIADDLFFLEDFRRAGFAVFAYDYRGYGTSTGKPSEKGAYADAHAAYDYLTQTLHVEPTRVISYGHSLGAAVAIELASTKPVAALIADAPFITAFRVLTRVPLLPWDKFDNASRIRRVHCPVLIIQGKADEVIPWWHGQRIYALANEPKRSLWIEKAGHNDIFVVASKQYLQAVNDFVASIEPANAQSVK